ncbi:hypothetical protein ABT071_03525 [Streptomyces sp. NPDC002506]|uniref:hypothetical protein n=1 Tax=Streptomyces sp. NPDC002506 TaxID=3154536 RepID=UPI00331C472A
MSTAELKSATGPDPDGASPDAGPAGGAPPAEAGPEAGRAPEGAPRGEPAAPPAGPPVETPAPLDEAAEPADEATVPLGEAAEPADEATEPADEGAEPADEATAPLDEAAEPADEATVPRDEATAPRDEATVPRDETAEPADGATAAPAPRLRRVLSLGCVVVLLLAGAGLLFQARQLTTTPATANRALTDASETTQVIGDVSNTLGKVFSYAAQDTSATEQASKELLSGRAASQYAALFGQLRQRAAEQKLSLATHVVRAGVTRLTHDRAELLVFLDQRAQRDSSAPTTAAAQLSVTAQLDAGHWQITDIRAR